MFKKIFFALLWITYDVQVSQASDQGYTFSLINEHGTEVYQEKFVPMVSNPTVQHTEQSLDTDHYTGPRTEVCKEQSVSKADEDHWTDYVACPLMTACCIYSYTVCPYATYATTGCCLAAVISQQSSKEPRKIE